MKPRFGPITRLLAGIFALGGIAAGLTGARSGPSSLPGDSDNGVILLLIALLFVVIAGGLWFEWIWGWYVGAGCSAAVVVLSVFVTHDDGWPVWLGILAMFVVSAIQGFMDVRASRH